jgi:transcription initiation factor IIE alpha subunit
VKVKTGSVKFECPDCNKEVDFQEAFTEEKLEDGIELVSLVCPYCNCVNVGYYSNQRIRRNLARLKEIRERHDTNYLQEYSALKTKHQKYFDKFQSLMRSGGEE